MNTSAAVLYRFGLAPVILDISSPCQHCNSSHIRTSHGYRDSETSSAVEMAVKFFGKEEASQDGKNQGTSREVALRQSLPEGSQGTIRKEIPTQSESPPSPYSKSHKDPAQESTSAHNVEVVGSLAAQTLKDGCRRIPLRSGPSYPRKRTTVTGRNSLPVSRHLPRFMQMQ